MTAKASPRNATHPMLPQGGFTLLELLVVIIIIAVVSAIAFPNFQIMTTNNRLASGANEVLAGLQSARMEALRRNTRVVVCPSTDGTACSGTDWSRHIAFVDTNRDGAVTGAEVVVRDTIVKAPAVVGVSAAISGATPAHRITFRPDGLARPGNDRNILAATLQVCVATTRPPNNARLVRLSGARVSVDAPAANAACAAPANQ